MAEKFKKTFDTVKSFDKVMFGCNVTIFSSFGSEEKSKVVALAYQWSGKEAWYAGNLRWTEKDNQRIVDVLHIEPLVAPLEKIHAFTLDGKGLINWLFSVVAIFEILFVFYALIICARTKIPKFKWLWMIFITVGFFKLNLNWTSGQVLGPVGNGMSGILISLLSIQIFAASYARSSDYAPMLVTISIPLGAIVFLMRRKKWLMSKAD